MKSFKYLALAGIVAAFGATQASAWSGDLVKCNPTGPPVGLDVTFKKGLSCKDSTNKIGLKAKVKDGLGLNGCVGNVNAPWAEWQAGKFEKLAKTLFCYDNPPGTAVISGSQDAIGIVYPGVARAHYAGAYWPHAIDHLTDEGLLSFVEAHLWLIPLSPRTDGYDPLDERHITPQKAAALAQAADQCWAAMRAQDAVGFGAGVRASFEAQIAMFPHMANETIFAQIDTYRDHALGWKLSGAGGGGYLILVSATPIDRALPISARRA